MNNSSATSRLLRNILIYASSDATLQLAYFFALPLVTAKLAPAEFGAWTIAFTITNLFICVIGFGDASVLNRFFFDKPCFRQRQIIITSWTLFLGLLACLASCFLTPALIDVALWTGVAASDLTFQRLLIASAPLLLINILLGQVLKDQFRALTSGILTLATTILNLSISLYAMFQLELGTEALALGLWLSNLLICPIRIASVWPLLQGKIDWKALRPMLAFGIPLMPAALAYWVFTVSDTFLLARLASTAELGQYAIAVKLAGLLAMIHAAFGTAWAPFALKLYAEQEAQAYPFFAKAMTHCLAFFFILGLLIFGFQHLIMTWFVAPAYWEGTSVMLPLLLANILHASTSIGALGISLTKRTTWLAAHAAIAAAINVIGNVLLIPQWGMLAAAWTTTAAYAYLAIACMLTSQQIAHILFHWKALAATATPSLLALLLLQQLSSTPPLVSALAGLMLTATVLGIYHATGTIYLTHRRYIWWGSAYGQNEVSISDSILKFFMK